MNAHSKNAPRPVCRANADQRCLTCADEAVVVRVISLNQQKGLALVEVCDQTGEQTVRANGEEIDTTLVDEVAAGDVLLAHAGVAIERLEKGERHAQ